MAVVLTGAVSAKPPGEGGPLSEARELDPVARDYYLPTPASEPTRDRAPARGPDKPGDVIGSFLAALGEMILHGPSIPLGTVRPDGAH